jgi:hypothetical protein
VVSKLAELEVSVSDRTALVVGPVAAASSATMEYDGHNGHHQPHPTSISHPPVAVSRGHHWDTMEPAAAPGTTTEDMLPRTRSAEERQLQEALAASLSMSSGVAALVRQASGRDTLCKICYGNYPPSQMVVSCRHNHMWCRECLGGYLTSKISESQLAVLCPDIDDATDVGCAELLSEELIRDVVDAQTVAAFERFREMKSNPNIRECPRDGCGHTQQTGSARHPEMICERCGQAYCFAHASAHPGETCRVYEKRQRDAEGETLWFLNQISKPCPKCKCPTQKNEGCNHMTCRNCKQDWCWICGRRTGAHGGSHYSPFNPLGCPMAQMMTNFIDDDSYCRTVLNYMALGAVKLLSFPMVVAALPVSLATALLVLTIGFPFMLIGWVVCGCGDTCNPGRSISEMLRDMDGADDLAFLFFFSGLWPVCLLGMLFALALHCCLLPIHCCVRALNTSYLDETDTMTAIFFGTAAAPFGLCCVLLTATLCLALSPILLIWALCSAPRPRPRPPPSDADPDPAAMGGAPTQPSRGGLERSDSLGEVLLLVSEEGRLSAGVLTAPTGEFGELRRQVGAVLLYSPVLLVLIAGLPHHGTPMYIVVV